jgi:hypothetical protein
LTESNVANFPAARRAIEAGASPDDLVRAMTAAAYEAVFRLLFLLSAEHTEEGNPEAKAGWMIVQAHLDESGRASPAPGADLDFLHEDLLTADPTGREGEDFFG